MAKGKTPEELAPVDFIPEICRRTGIAAASLLAMYKLAEIQGRADDPRAQGSRLVSEYMRAAGIFVAENKDAILAVVNETGANYNALTRAINDAIYANTGGPWKNCGDFDGEKILADLVYRLRTGAGKKGDPLLEDVKTHIQEYRRAENRPPEAVAESLNVGAGTPAPKLAEAALQADPVAGAEIARAASELAEAEAKLAEAEAKLTEAALNVAPSRAAKLAEAVFTGESVMTETGESVMTETDEPVMTETGGPVKDTADALAEFVNARAATQNSDRLDYLDVAGTPASLTAQTMLEVVMRAEHGVESLERLKYRRSAEGTEWNVEKPGSGVLISRKNSKGEFIEVGFKSLNKFEKNRAGGAQKMATLILTKAGRNMRDGKLASPCIALNAAELVGLGMYQHKKDARRAIRSAVDAFSDFKLSAQYLDGGKWRRGWVAIITATDSDFDGDDLFVKLNADINWAAICSQYTPLPTFYYAIEKSRAATLCQKIFDLARMQGHDLLDEKAPAFFVNLDPTVMEWLDIPAPATTNKAKRDIKDPIIESVAEINKKAGTEILRLETRRGAPLDPDLPVRQWITGRLRADIRGTPAWKPLLEVFKENKKVQKQAAREARRAGKKEGAIDARTKHRRTKRWTKNTRNKK